jgi:hypothetical protein
MRAASWLVVSPRAFEQLTLILSSSVVNGPLKPHVPMSAPRPLIWPDEKPTASLTSASLPQNGRIS